VRQAEPFEPRYLLGHTATTLTADGRRWILGTDRGARVRCVPGNGAAVADASAFNAAVRRKLMADGRALLARTKVAGPDGTPRVHLKLVFLNPATTEDDIDALLTDVTAVARELAGQAAAGG
jgi:hypothetical protein